MRALTLAWLLCLTTVLSAAQPTALTVHDARVRWLPAALPLAGYFELRNAGDRPARLVGVSSARFRSIEMHHSMGHGGMSAMQPIHERVVPARGAIRFAPGGYHLMLMDPVAPVRVGQQVPIRLHFSDGTTLDADFSVRGPDTP